MEVPYTTFSIRVTDPLSQKKTKLQAPPPTPPLEKIKLAAKTNSPPPPPPKKLTAPSPPKMEDLYTP